MNCTYLLKKYQDNRCLLFVNKLSNDSIEINLKKFMGQCQQLRKNALDTTFQMHKKLKLIFKRREYFVTIPIKYHVEVNIQIATI